MNYHDWRSEQNPIRRTAKRLLSGDPLKDGRPLSELIELDEHARKCLPLKLPLPTSRLKCCRSWAICRLPAQTSKGGHHALHPRAD